MSSLLKEALAQLIQREVSDPRLQNIVVTDVDMSADLKIARVYFTKSQMEPSWDEKEALAGFKKAAPYLRRMLGEKMDLKSVPELRFEKDTHTDQLNRILHLIDLENPNKPEKK